MIRAFAALAFLAAALFVGAENTDAAIYAAITAVVLITWAARDADWRNPFRPVRRVSGIPATRDMQRVLTVLLTGAPGLSGFPISRLSGVGSGGVYVCLDRLEVAGWIVGEWEVRSDDRPRHRFYRLTPRGHACALDLLGLEDRPEVAA